MVSLSPLAGRGWPTPAKAGEVGRGAVTSVVR